MSEPFDHCQRLVHEADRDRYIATLFAPADRRPALFALHAFAIELERVREAVSGPMPGEIRLQWWRDALAGHGHGDVAANPVAAALLKAMAQHLLSLEALEAMIDARGGDLYDDPLPTIAALERYAADTAAVALAAAVLDRAAADGSTTGLRHAGTALGLGGLLHAFPWLVARGQSPLPAELMQRHGVGMEDLHAKRDTAGLRAALAELRALTRRHFAALTEEGVPDALVPALLPVALVPRWLDRLDRAQDPFQPVDFPRWRRQWAMWRAARRPVSTWT